MHMPCRSPRPRHVYSECHTRLQLAPGHGRGASPADAVGLVERPAFRAKLLGHDVAALLEVDQALFQGVDGSALCIGSAGYSRDSNMVLRCMQDSPYV